MVTRARRTLSELVVSFDGHMDLAEKVHSTRQDGDFAVEIEFDHRPFMISWDPRDSGERMFDEIGITDGKNEYTFENCVVTSCGLSSYDNTVGVVRLDIMATDMTKTFK